MVGVSSALSPAGSSRAEPSLPTGLVTGRLAEALTELPLIDHHAHGALRHDPDRTEFEGLITEAPTRPTAYTQFDSQIGFAIRRWCAPLVDLPPHAAADDYWRRRAVLGNEEVTRRMLRASGIETYLIDTGHGADQVLSPREHAIAAKAEAREIVRLETVAETALTQCRTGATFASDFRAALRSATVDAVGVKSILAYRCGFDIPLARPSERAVQMHADATLAGGNPNRIDDPVLLMFLLWAAVDLGLPIQIHCGYGDPDLDLHRSNPALLTSWIRSIQDTQVPIMLLHCYPYHREAGYLAQVFDNVYFDVGEGLNYVGARAPAVVSESLELAPFHKQLFSTDAWGPAELHLLGAWQWKRAFCSVAGQWVDGDDWSMADAEKAAALIAYKNAQRVYKL